MWTKRPRPKLEIKKSIDYWTDHSVTVHVWQELFNIYRERGGDLCDMHNMICDLTSIEKFVENKQNVFYWSFTGRGTQMTADKVTALTTCYDYRFEIEVDRIHSRFSIKELTDEDFAKFCNGILAGK